MTGEKVNIGYIVIILAKIWQNDGRGKGGEGTQLAPTLHKQFRLFSYGKE